LKDIFTAMFGYKLDAVVNMYSQKAGILVTATFTMFLAKQGLFHVLSESDQLFRYYGSYAVN
jgi:hypothetical protein